MEKHIKSFLNEFNIEIKKISQEDVAKVINVLHFAYKNGGKIFLIGNGGSSAIASHFANDLNKSVLGHKGEKNIKRFQAICLSDNVPVLTALANDVGYESVFSEQLKNFIQDKDVLLAISSSGNSPNIIKAAELAKAFHIPVIGFMGFDGGKLLSLSDAKIHIPSFKYGIVESVHEAVCHLIAAYFEETIR